MNAYVLRILLLAMLTFVLPVSGKDDIGALALFENPWLKKPLTEVSKAANNGNLQAQLAMAITYDFGAGAKFGSSPEIDAIPADGSKAAYWYEQAAKQNDWTAQYNLAVLYYYGRGVRKDHAKAKQLFELAAKSGDRLAQAALAMYYMNIEIGGKPYPIYTEGAKWHLLAAEGGDWYSQLKIGLLYEMGLGVVRDRIQALKWYYISASNGHEPALVQANRLEELMSPSDVEKAASLAKAFTPRPKKK